ncbi:MAG: DUF4136 domain-containing protein [Gammaproteobacteria bacterium]
MKFRIYIFYAFFVLFYITACSSIKVSQDYDKTYNFSTLKKFSWLDNSKNEYGAKDNDLADKRIRSAIRNKLTAKAYTESNTGTPDFYISYHVTIKQKVSSSNVSGGISMGRSSYGRYGSVGISSGSQVRVYNQGTLLIDITDPQTKKLIWRGISTQPVSEHLKPGESESIINETVEKMLQQFPPVK